jgi:hypothetical protein
MTDKEDKTMIDAFVAKMENGDGVAQAVALLHVRGMVDMYWNAIEDARADGVPMLDFLHAVFRCALAVGGTEIDDLPVKERRELAMSIIDVAVEEINLFASQAMR